MKKTLIVVLLIACVCVPEVFAYRKIAACPMVGLSTSMTFDDGAKFQGIGISGSLFLIINAISPVCAEFKIELIDSFNDDTQTGVYCEAFTEFDAFGGIGIETSFHMVDGSLVANFGVAAKVGYPAVLSFGTVEISPTTPAGPSIGVGPYLTARYFIINNTGAPDFSLDFSLNTFFYTY